MKIPSFFCILLLSTASCRKIFFHRIFFLKHITSRMASFYCHYKPFRLLFLLFPNQMLARSQQAVSAIHFFFKILVQSFENFLKVWWHDATLFYLFFLRTFDNNFPANKYRKRNDHWEKPSIDCKNCVKNLQLRPRLLGASGIIT